MRIALGTAQFGMPYGVANSAGQPALNECRRILHDAHRAGINMLDTAIAYGDSESRLGEMGISEWAVVTKLAALPESVNDVSAWVTEQTSHSLNRLRVPQLAALLLHRSSDLVGPRRHAVRDALLRIKDLGLTQLVGVSIYDPSELTALWPFFKPELVQAPYNVFDQRLVRSGWLQRLAGEGVRVHARAAFLQGVLLMPAAKRPGYFNSWANLFDRWERWCAEHGSSPLAAALRFALAETNIEKIVVGVDSASQLAEVIDAATLSASVPPNDLCWEDRNLIEPTRWNFA